MFKEFKAFALKGNVVDLAVGVIIGAAFGKIVTSVVNDLIMPLVGLVTGARSFGNLFVMLKRPASGIVITTIEEAKAANIPTLNYGLFISQVVDFLIVALVIFFIIKALTKVKTFSVTKRGKTSEVIVEAPTTKICPYCKTIIDIEATRCPACTSELDGNSASVPQLKSK